MVPNDIWLRTEWLSCRRTSVLRCVERYCAGQDTGKKPCTADVIVGPIGIVIADALLGEITPAMAAAVCQSPARRVLVPINHCENIVVGVPDQPIGQLVAAAAQKVKELVATPCE